MSIASEITRIDNAIASAYDAIEAKGGTMPAEEKIANMATAIASIPTGGVTPTGNIELTQQTGTDVSAYATASVRSGSVTLSTPSVNSSGLVTASASVGTSGWVGSAPSNATLQLSTQSAKTVTPSDSSQTAVESGKYTTGAVTVAAVSTQTKSTTANGTITPDSGKYLSSVTVNVPTGTARTSSDIQLVGRSVLIPDGLYSEYISYALSRGDVDAPIATKGTVSNHSVSVTPSADVTAGYISSGGRYEGAPVTVSASDLVSGNNALTASTSTQTNIDVTNYATVSVAPTPTETATATANGTVTPSSGKYLSSVTVAIPTYDGTVV